MYYIYKLTIEEHDIYFGSYIGQHKMEKKEPMNDNYYGSGSQWKKYILSNNIPITKEILCYADNVEEANLLEKCWVAYYKFIGEYLWNRTKGGGNHESNKIYTDEEVKQHIREYNKQYYLEHKIEKKQWDRKYYQTHKEYRREYKKQYCKINKEKTKEHQKQYDSRLCNYNGEILTLCALRNRFSKQHIPHPVLEAKKYLIEKD